MSAGLDLWAKFGFCASEVGFKNIQGFSRVLAGPPARPLIIKSGGQIKVFNDELMTNKKKDIIANIFKDEHGEN